MPTPPHRWEIILSERAQGDIATIVNLDGPGAGEIIRKAVARLQAALSRGQIVALSGTRVVTVPAHTYRIACELDRRRACVVVARVTAVA
jgi:hypothetical protein